MEFVKVDRLYRELIKKLDKNSFRILVDYTRYISDEYEKDPDLIFELLRKDPESDPKENDQLDTSKKETSLNEDNSEKIEETSEKVEESLEEFESALESNSETTCAEKSQSESSFMLNPLKRQSSSNVSNKGRNGKRKKIELCAACKVDKSISNFYGVPTCSSCKSFFQKYYPIRDQFKCDNEHKCFKEGCIFKCKKCRIDNSIKSGLIYREKILPKPKNEKLASPEKPKDEKEIN
ncbi:unnamed protein product [Brachionus calyciflorus]|uniref:Nuclear receptor domain-containing protein n=1 Tax=Brachionus calyciflorus TaxID=104777 RepID=A0A813VWA5_9BILA|nr:unnamed protein product [Brachionus calyciflorus]